MKPAVGAIGGRVRRPGGPGTGNRGLWGALGSVAAGSMVANLASYVVYIGASQWLSAGDYGEFARLLSAMLVLGVPALALQSVIARETVHGVGVVRARVLTAQITAVVAAGLVLAVPIVVAVAKVGLGAAIAALCTAPLLVVIAGGQGVLQGIGEFRALAWVLAAVGGLRTIPVVVALAVGAGPAAALWAGTAGAAVAAAAVWMAVAGVMSADARPSTAESSATATAASVLRASQVQLVLIVAVSIDLLLSGSVLSSEAAGVYALGAIATKAAFWLPQAIGVVFYPQLADAASSRTSLRTAVRVVAMIGAVLTVGAALAGPLIPVILGADFQPLTSITWLFAYTGAVLAILQVLLLSSIAADRTHLSLITWVVVALEAAVILTVCRSVVALAATAAISVTIATVITWVVGQCRGATHPRHF